MKQDFTCSVLQERQLVRWAHVAADNSRAAVQAAVDQTKVKGLCRVEVFRGRMVPFDPAQSPAATATVMV